MSNSNIIPIYKVNHVINNNIIDTIYVFYGINIDIDNPQELFDRDPTNEAFSNVFNKEEFKTIQDKSNNIKVRFSKQQIHYDDNIGTIKQKIMREFSNAFSLEEIYLFCLKEELLHSESVFQTLTQNGKLKLTRACLDNFLLNIKKDENGNSITLTPPETDKDTYDYDDILALNIDNKKFAMSKVLGQKIFIISNEYPFVSNPYNIDEYDRFIERASAKSLTTLNSNLLLNTGEIIDNNIYLCLAKNVLENANAKKLSETYIIKLYYPTLFRKFNINSLSELDNQRENLIEANNKIFNESVAETYKSVDLFYDIYKYRDESKNLKYKNSGIKSIKIAMHPLYKIKIPLDVIFKLVHATELSPLIKFNPSVRQENVYRLYTDKLAIDGRKIPLLSKAKIFKLMRDIGKSKSVAVYIHHEMNGITYSLVCEFEENGNIMISCDFGKIIDITDITELFKDAVNPIINEIKNYLEQSGYKIHLFESLFDEHVEIKLLNYQAIIAIDKLFNVDDNVAGCLTSAFVIESKKLQTTKGIEMRFKRVSNFNKRTSQEAFIIEKQKQGLRGKEEFIEALMENYKMSAAEARELIEKMANELQVERGVKGNDIEIKINPGFKTTIKLNNILNQITNVITIDVENIDDINYLNTIPVYLDSFIRLTQDKTSTRIPVDYIHALCSTGEKVDIVMEDITSSSEESFPDSDVPVIIGDNDIEYQSINEREKQPLNEEEEEDKFQNVLDLFGYNDEDDEEEDEESSSGGKKGGQSSTASSSTPQSTSSLKEGDVLGSDEFQSEKSLSDFNEESPSPVPSPVKEPIKPIEVAPVFEEKIVLESSPVHISIPVQKKKGKKSVNVQKEVMKEALNENVRNIDGMPLKNNSNPFVNRIEEHDPTALVMQSPDGKFLSYSRMCSSSARQQPVLLTDEELEKIKKDKPDFLQEGDVIKYGSTPDKQFNYICPRYWCLTTQTPLTDDDIAAGKCGGKDSIIPRSATSVPKGKHIFEFFDPSQHGTKDKYIKHYPSFVKNTCFPCCYKNWDTQGQLSRRAICSGKKEDEKGNPIQEKEPPKKITEKDDYVKGPDKFPLEIDRWGYLPMSIQKFLHELNSSCQISKTNTNIKLSHTCLLRHGVEINSKQSFIACISDAIFYGKMEKNAAGKNIPIEIPNIDKMKQIIIDSINVDNFITFQNGNLVDSFTKDTINKDINAINNVDISDYSSGKLTSTLYSKIAPGDDNTLVFFKKIVAAFANFKSYMKDNTEIIDYTYLWDIICKPNPNLFPQGVNLVILEIPDNDTTSNVELLCPTNHYASEFYEARKQTLIILKHGLFYEPIYAYRTDEKTTNVKKTFSEYDPQLSKTMRAVFKKVIKPIIHNTCIPLASMPNKYKLFKQPILLYNLIHALNKINYSVITQVVNFQGKVIGIVAKNPFNQTGFIPCYPTAINETMKYVFMNADNLFDTYANTIAFLKTLYKDSNETIPCNPIYQIVEDEHIVGLLTQTNQFIQLTNFILLSSPERNTTIKVLNNNNYLFADEEVSTSYKVDEERVDYIKRIKLETHFFNVFRNTIRILLNKYENIKLREQIEREINLPYILYNVKLKKVITYLRDLVKKTILFSDEYDYKNLETNEISTCIVVPNNKCDSKQPVCVVNSDNICQLVLPKQHLITQADNESYYFGRMSDELIRYNRIKSFIFQPQSYLSFGTLGYNLKDNEIIVIQSILTQEYFDGLVAATINKYVKDNTYDTAEPIIHQIYENELDLDNVINPEEERDCVTELSTHIASMKWRPCFPSDFNELKYENSNYCGFYLIIDIIKKFKGTLLTLDQLKQELYEEYLKYLPTYEKQIVDILIAEGKKTLGDQVKSNHLSFQHLIFTDSYFITNLDLWVLMNKYNIPSILISSKTILETNHKTDVLVTYGNLADKFVFIMAPPSKQEHTPKYKLIVSPALPTQDIFFHTTILQTDECIESVTNAISNKIPIDEYIRTFSKTPTTKYVKKIAIPRGRLVMVEDQELEEPIAQPVVNLLAKTKKVKTIQPTGIQIKKSRKHKRKTKLILQSDSTPSADAFGI